MARYIDAEQFRGKHDVAEVNGKLNSVILYADIVYAPTAEVVPKSEVKKIFAEIEKVIGEKYEEYVFDNLDIEGVKQDAIIEFADCMKEYFAELKKKYTEEKE